MSSDPQRPKRALPPYTPGMCMAVVDDYERPHWHASMQRIVIPNDKRCSRKGKALVGTLHLCTVHARLAWEGFVDVDGRVADRNTIRDHRHMRWEQGRPSMAYHWTLKLDRTKP